MANALKSLSFAGAPAALVSTDFLEASFQAFESWFPLLAGRVDLSFSVLL